MAAQNWVTVAQACETFGISRRTLSRWIKQGKIESKLENGHRLVAVPIERRSDADIGQLLLIGQLLSEAQHLRQQVTDLQDELKRKDAQAQRQKWASFWHR